MNIKIYRYLQIHNQIVNVIFGHIFLAVQLLTLLGLGILSAFFFMRWSNYLEIVPSLSLLLVVGGSTFAVYVEIFLTSTLAETGEEFLRGIKSKFLRKTYLGKVAKSCWPLHFKLAMPFFLISHDCFLEYMRQLIEFLTTMLLSIERS